MDIKNMPFGKLMMIFGGVLIVTIILAFIIIKASAGAKPSKNAVVTKRIQPQFQDQQPDIMVEQLRKAQLDAADKSAALAASAKQTQELQQSMQQQNQVVMQQLNNISNNLVTLNQRTTALENNRYKSVEIIKPKREPHSTSIKRLDKSATPLSPSSGYTVQATVGKRAWITAGEHEDSVTVGEKLPPVKRTQIVRAVDSESGIIITSAQR